MRWPCACGSATRFALWRPSRCASERKSPMAAKSHFINGQWLGGEGQRFKSVDPAAQQEVWEGHAATDDEVGRAVMAVRKGGESWSDPGPAALQKRIFHLEAFAQQLKDHRSKLAEAISRETGKPTWEALSEVDSMIGKVPVSIDAFNTRRRPIEHETPGGGSAATRFKPYGVVAVFGPFNFPGHLPNGQIVPALLAGNAVVFKPSECAPLVAEITAGAWRDAGLPAGVLNLVQ